MSSMVVLCPAAWSEKHTSRLTMPAAMHAKPMTRSELERIEPSSEIWTVASWPDFSRK